MILVWESSIINAIMWALKTWRNYNNETPISKCWLHNFSKTRKKSAKKCFKWNRKPVALFCNVTLKSIQMSLNKENLPTSPPSTQINVCIYLIWSLWLSSLCNMTFGFHRHLPAIVMITHRDIWCTQTESNHSHSGCRINLMHQIYVHQIHRTAYLLPLMEA